MRRRLAHLALGLSPLTFAACTNQLARPAADGGRGWFTPNGEPWTILIGETDGPQRRQQAESIAASLRRTPGIRAADLRVEHGPQTSRIAYGVYYRETQPGTLRLMTPAKMTEDLQLIKGLVTPDRVLQFAAAQMVPIPTANPGNPGWDLRKADGVYTLQVAAFYNTGDFNDRKAAAAEYTRMLREKGHTAFYLHGQRISIVTVGVFDAGAVVPIDLVPRHVFDEDGQPIRVEASQVATRYSDAVFAAQKRDELFKYNLTNGHIAYSGREPVPSALVRIPEPEAGE